jgi:hypothetical protein
MAYFGIPVQIGSSQMSNKLTFKPDLTKVLKLLDATFKAPKDKVIQGPLVVEVGKDKGHCVIFLCSGNDYVS